MSLAFGLLSEYGFDYADARANRFAGKRQQGKREVVLDADVAAVFTTSESVNAVLRALIDTMPKPCGGGPHESDKAPKNGHG